MKTLIEKLVREWQLECRDHLCDADFEYIGSNARFDLYLCRFEKRLKPRVRAFVRSGAVIVIYYPEHPEYIDLCLQSALDDVPVYGIDIPWQTSPDLIDAGNQNSLAEFSYEIDKCYGRRRLERKYVTDFKAQYKYLAASWENLEDDTTEAREALSLTTLLRLLFLSFIASRYILDNRLNFIQEEAMRVSARNGSIYRDFLQPLFFETLNRPVCERPAHVLSFGDIPFLNGGLFMPTLLEQQSPQLNVSNRCWLDVIGVLLDGYTYNSEFSDPDSGRLDPMMLGHIFESLMSDKRRAMTGSFYTPMPHAQMIVHQTLMHWLMDRHLDASQAEKLCKSGDAQTLDRETASRVLADISKLTVLDPAAGSGSFLQSAHQCLYRMRTALMDCLEIAYHAGTLAKSILVENLYGVDIVPEANHICELRLWLEVIQHYEIGERIPTLPNLDVNIRCGDSLVDVSQYRRALGIAFPQSAPRKRCEELKRQYRLASGMEKKRLAEEIDREITMMSEQIYDAIVETHHSEESSYYAVTRSLFESCGEPAVPACVGAVAASHKRFNAWRTQNGIGPGFSYDIHFGDILERGGFDIVIGNPPWFSLHTMPRESQKVIRMLYQTAGNVTGKSSQSPDISAVFVEKSLGCVRPDGLVSMLIPNKLFYAPSYRKFRSYTESTSEILEIKDLSASGQRAMFDASTYPASIILKKSRHLGSSRRQPVKWPGNAVGSKDRFDRISSKLGDRFTIKRGIYTCANHLYIGTDIRSLSSDSIIDSVAGNDSIIDSGAGKIIQDENSCRKPALSSLQFSDGTVASIEIERLRPVIRGASIRAYHVECRESIIFTHDNKHPEVPLKSLPKYTKAWFDAHLDILSKRSNARHGNPYTLFGCSACLNCKKVVWRDISEKLEACYLPEGEMIPLNTVYYIPVDDDRTGYILAAYLNSTLVRDWCFARATHAQNNYRRYFAWLISDIPDCIVDLDSRDRKMSDRIVSISKKCHQAFDSDSDENMKKIDRLFEDILGGMEQKKRISGNRQSAIDL